AIERPGGFRSVRDGVVGRRIALVVASRLCAETGRERFASFRRHEGLRWASRSDGLFVTLRDGPFGNAALLEGVLGRGRDGAGSNALHPRDPGGQIARARLIAPIGVGAPRGAA